MEANTTANYCTAVGQAALAQNTEGNDNTAIGYNTLDAVTTGTRNVAVGNLALTSLTSNYCTAVGFEAGEDCNAQYNTFVGYQAGLNVTTGTQNIYIGSGAGNACTTGSQNVFIGHNIGSNTTSGGRCVYIGYNVQSSNTSGDSLMIGSGNKTHSGNYQDAGFIGPGTGAGGYGYMYQGNNQSTWATTSDIRIKKNIVDNDIGLKEILQLKVKNFEYRLPEEIEDEKIVDRAVPNTGLQVGVIAQEVEDILPDIVETHKPTGVMSVNPNNLTWYLVNAVKELAAEVEKLKNGS